MKIKQKKVVKVENYLTDFNVNDEIIIMLGNLQEHSNKLSNIGFSEDLELGERILPAIVGSVSKFNAEGKYRIRKDKPKEIVVIYQREWHWKQWDGSEHSKIVDVERPRYPREFIPPPGVEFEIVENDEGEKLLVTDAVTYTPENLDLIKHTINLFLEIFGECEIVNEEFEQPLGNVKILNWTILPKGKYPWEKLKESIAPVLEKAKKGKVPIIESRLEHIAKYGTEDVMVGNAGFRGYVIFGFPEKDIYIVESAYYGNATYVFDKDFEELSKLTKAEILNEELQLARIIHSNGWSVHVDGLLG